MVPICIMILKQAQYHMFFYHTFQITALLGTTKKKLGKNLVSSVILGNQLNLGYSDLQNNFTDKLGFHLSNGVY